MLTITQQLKHQQRLGRRPSDVTANQLKMDELRAASWVDRVGMIASASASLVRTRVFRQTVGRQAAESNEAICRACPSGKFEESKDRHPYCNECGCSGRMLMTSKWEDPTAQCPLDHWDNTTRELVDVTVDGTEVSGDE